MLIARIRGQVKPGTEVAAKYAAQLNLPIENKITAFRSRGVVSEKALHNWLFLKQHRWNKPALSRRKTLLESPAPTPDNL